MLTPWYQNVYVTMTLKGRKCGASDFQGKVSGDVGAASHVISLLVDVQYLK